MSSGLALPGSLSITEATLTAVGTTMVKNVDFNVAEADRTSADGTSSFVYYIQATYDINSQISYTASSALDAKDDAYACLLYTSPSPRDLSTSRMPSSA